MVFLKRAAAVSNTQQVGLCSAALTKGNHRLRVSVRDAVGSTGTFVALTE